MIQARALRKTFGDLVAVEDLSLEIKTGEAFGLLGPNGAGKTTTINMLMGLLPPDRGQVLIDEKWDPVTPEARLRLGIAPQSLSLYEELTAVANLRFFAKLYGLRGQPLNERVDWALQFAQLTDRGRSRVKTFSGGMKRRLNLACALIHDPQIVLMDEPTVGVDPQSRNHLFECIEQLKRQQKTILYTTHYMEEAQRLCDRIAIIDHGRLLAIDTVASLIRDHGGTSVVLAELHDPPANTPLPGELREGTLRFESRQPLEDILELKQQGAVFGALQVTQPDLETVFLSLTGRSLRDD
ncbi:MAG: ABC transporter ATP-binding protein [Planctomycetota bacterium]